MITPKEALLLTYLRQNSRMRLAKISKDTNIPVSTIFETLKRLESSVILKHTALIDFSKFGYGVKINFVLKSKSKSELKEFLLSNKSVNSLYSLTGDYDFFAECIFKDLKEMTDFKDLLEKFDIDEIYHTFVVEEIKKEEFAI